MSFGCCTELWVYSIKALYKCLNHSFKKLHVTALTVILLTEWSKTHKHNVSDHNPITSSVLQRNGNYKNSFKRQTTLNMKHFPFTYKDINLTSSKDIICTSMLQIYDIHFRSITVFTNPYQQRTFSTAPDYQLIIDAS